MRTSSRRSQQFSYIRLVVPLLDTTGSVLSFVERSVFFSFIYSLGSVTAMPRGLHASLCHAFLVFLSLISLICMFRSSDSYWQMTIP